MLSKSRIFSVVTALAFFFIPTELLSTDAYFSPSVQGPAGGAINRVLRSLKKVRPVEPKVPKGKKTFPFGRIKNTPIDDIAKQTMKDSSSFRMNKPFPGAMKTYELEVNPYSNPNYRWKPNSGPTLTNPLDTLDFERKMWDLKRSIENTRKKSSNILQINPNY